MELSNRNLYFADVIRNFYTHMVNQKTSQPLLPYMPCGQHHPWPAKRFDLDQDQYTERKKLSRKMSRNRRMSGIDLTGAVGIVFLFGKG